MTALPVVDLSLLDRSGTDAAEFLAALRGATHDVGFFSLVGHGIPDDVTTRAFAEAERFFALPVEDKRQIEMLNSPHFRGYNRTGGELTGGRVDWREQYGGSCTRGPSRWAARPVSSTVPSATAPPL